MNLSVCTWDVRIECRKQGAIGIFEWKVFRLRAKDQEHAFAYGVEDAHMQEYETRFGSAMRLS